MNDGLFSMEEKREGNDGKAMVSFMVPAALKNELQARARQLHITATRLMAEAIQLRLRKTTAPTTWTGSAPTNSSKATPSGH